MLDECKNCKYRNHNVCANQCGEYGINGAHPLSPCYRWDCYDDQNEEPICETEEMYILEGNRCQTYVAWLTAMRNEEQRVKNATK